MAETGKGLIREITGPKSVWNDSVLGFYGNSEEGIHDSLESAVERADEIAKEGFAVGFELLIPSAEERGRYNFFKVYDNLIKMITKIGVFDTIQSTFKDSPFKAMGLSPNITVSRKALGLGENGIYGVGILNISALENNCMITVPMELGYEHTIVGSRNQGINDNFMTSEIMFSSPHAEAVYIKLKEKGLAKVVKLTEGTYQFGFCQRIKGYSSLRKARLELVETAIKFLGGFSPGINYIKILTHDTNTLNNLTMVASAHDVPKHRYEFQAQMGSASDAYKHAVYSARDNGHLVRINIPIALERSHADNYLKRMVALNR